MEKIRDQDEGKQRMEEVRKTPQTDPNMNKITL